MEPLLHYSSCRDPVQLAGPTWLQPLLPQKRPAPLQLETPLQDSHQDRGWGRPMLERGEGREEEVGGGEGGGEMGKGDWRGEGGGGRDGEERSVC